MPNNEDDQPDFEQLDDLFDESLPEADPLGGDSDLDPLSESGFGSLEDAGEQDEDLPDKKSKKKKKKGKKKVKAKKEKAPKKPKEEKDRAESAGLLQTLRGASPYTVMLGLTFLAIVIAILCQLKELMEYDMDIGAETYKQQARLDPGSQFDTYAQLGPATTAAAACPFQVRLTSSAGVPVEGIGSSRMT